MRPENNLQEWHQQKTYESLMTYGVGAIKFVLVANGGAILSILTFIGNHEDKIPKLSCSMVWFVVGVVVGGIVNISAYMTQLSLFNQRENVVSIWKNHKIYLYFSIFLIAFGILSFSIGSLTAVFALTSGA